MKAIRTLAAVLAATTVLLAATAWAENEGLDDLDKATEAKLNAQTFDDLTGVVTLLDSALKKGLDKDNTDFANKLLSSTLEGRAKIIAGAILDRPQVDPRWPQLRTLAVTDLQRAVSLDDTLIEGHYLLGRLQALPEGDTKQALESLKKVVDSDQATKEMKVKSLITRATLNKNAEDQLADFNKAIELDPENAESYRSRGLYHLLKEQPKEAIEDLKAAAKLDPKSGPTYEALGMAYFIDEKLDEALSSFDKAIELTPDSGTAYLQRARVFIVRNDFPKAIENLDKALELNPQALAVLLLRARVHAQADDNDKALADVEQASKIRGGKLPAMQLKAEILAASDRLDEAIEQMEELTELLPTNSELVFQLGLFYVANEQPRKGIEKFTSVLEANADNWRALRSRGDAYLSIAQQAAAIQDYETALKIQPDEEGVLNNLAWVLCTSPDEKLRNGKRALELAEKAAQASDYKKGFILSTLAAAYAETGDFEKARQWSQKAIDNGREGEIEQLKAELASYKQEKPWREVQETEEKSATAEKEKKPKKAPARTADF
jgi:tetratricopeptide (TPR) repeat protein